jgi:hypothetical protein
MPADDLILNVRQIAGYPPVDAVDPAMSVVMQLGLGGPYYSAAADVLVSSALEDGTLPFQLGSTLPADAIGGQIVTQHYLSPGSGWWLWNGYVQDTANLGLARLISGPSALMRWLPNVGWQWFNGGNGVAGSAILFPNSSIIFSLDPSGYVTVGNQILLGRDPVAPMEAATANWVLSSSVASFNDRVGPVRLSIDDIILAGGVSRFSPRFDGQPVAPTPPPWSHSGRLATTAFVHRGIVEYISNCLATQPFVFTFNGRSGNVTLEASDLSEAGVAPLDSPQFTGSPTAPTPAPGDASSLIATTAFVDAAITAALALVDGMFAPLASPQFTGFPAGPTAAPGTASGQLATTAFVMDAVAASVAGVASFNTRTGLVELELADITGAGGAPLNSPVFTGTPQAPQAALGAANDQIATCAWVQAELGGTGSVVSFNGRSGAIILTSADLTGAGGALSASPALTGVPTAPTAATGTSTGQLATTAFVAAAIGSAGGVTTFNGRAGAITLTAADISAAGGAALNSPAFVGTPTAPTAAPAVNNTQLATTAYVTAAVAAAGGVSSFNTRSGAITLTSADITNAGGALASALAAYLPLAGGTMTGPLAAAQGTTIVGVTDNSQAAAGDVGEVQSFVNAGTASVGSGASQNITSLPLTAGDWDVFAEAWGAMGSAVTMTNFTVGLSMTSAFIPTAPSMSASRAQVTGPAVGSPVLPLRPLRVNLSAPGTVYLGVGATFTGATAITCGGVIWARRAR